MLGAPLACEKGAASVPGSEQRASYRHPNEDPHYRHWRGPRKVQSLLSEEIRRFRSSKKLTAPATVRKVLDFTKDWDYAVSIGFSGRVIEGKPAAEPPKLGSGWVNFDFSSVFKRPVRRLKLSFFGSS
ncbi:MAG: hypothetical protein ACREX9_13335 [Gammaproteobacteria bacterium]